MSSNFRIIRQMTVNNANLVSSNITETDYPLYNPATINALADRVMLISPSSVVTITVGTPAVVSWVAHGQAAGTPVTFSTTGALPSGLVAGKRYFIATAGLATDSFQVTETVGGTALTTTGTQSGTHTATAQVHDIYESLQAGNTGHYPSLAASASWWLKIGATNLWKPFDSSVTSQASNADSITYTFQASGRINAIGLLNVSASTARVTMTDVTDGVVYDVTKTLTSNSGIHSWYSWFFEPLIRNTDVLFSDLPTYNNATISVTLTDTGSVVKCGAIVMGQSLTVGTTQSGASVGIQDYSQKTQDAFGNFTILQRAFAKRGNFSVWVDNQLHDQTLVTLASLRATAALYVASDDFKSTYIYGFYKDFNQGIQMPTQSILNIEIEGLT